MHRSQNFDELLMGFIGETLREKIGRENFDESLAICQSCPPSNFRAIQLCNECTTLIKHTPGIQHVQ